MSKLVNGQPLVSVKNIKKYFKTVKAVDGVSFEMGEGEFVALLGPNGAGKEFSFLMKVKYILAGNSGIITKLNYTIP
jgi:ABC-type sugar transport system ATPase subunit